MASWSRTASACRCNASARPNSRRQPMPLKVEPILPRFGAECSGLDLTKPLSPEEVKEVIGAMDTYGVCVYRDTGMSDDDHVEFSRNFGYLERVPRKEG